MQITGKLTYKSNQNIFIIAFGTALLVVVVLLSASIGALHISFADIFQIILNNLLSVEITDNLALKANVFWQIRLPRVFLAVLIGASLSTSGVALQGIFRNPLADAGLIGITAGSGLFAVLTIVGIARFLPDLAGYSISGFYLINIMAVVGAILTSLLIFIFSSMGGKTIIAFMILTGVALNALCGSLVGLLTYTATDTQLRSITFWMMGSLAGANWGIIQAILPFTLLPVLLFPFLSNALDVFGLGEEEAFTIGVKVQTLKSMVIILTTLAVGASVACCGMVGFLGLIVPHFVRIILGSGHKYLFVGSAIGGAILLSLSDTVCRTIIAPAELPINILTAIIGTPVFISILVREKRKNLFL